MVLNRNEEDVMQGSNFSKKGFSDSRVWSLHDAARTLHHAVCQLDDHNLELFQKEYGGFLGVFDLLRDYSSEAAGVREVKAPCLDK
jgi:hypothetical protein